LEGSSRKFYQAEFDFIDRITSISGAIKSIPKGEARKKACLKALAEIQLLSVNYLPTNPESILLEIDYASANPMQRYILIPKIFF
jgi:phosphatidylinositol 4-kinase